LEDVDSIRHIGSGGSNPGFLWDELQMQRGAEGPMMKYYRLPMPLRLLWGSVRTGESQSWNNEGEAKIGTDAGEEEEMQLELKLECEATATASGKRRRSTPHRCIIGGGIQHGNDWPNDCRWAMQ
jgi:hypothetical protein